NREGRARQFFLPCPWPRSSVAAGDGLPLSAAGAGELTWLPLTGGIEGPPSRGREVMAKARIMATIPAAPKRRRAVKGSLSLRGRRRFSTILLRGVIIVAPPGN